MRIGPLLLVIAERLPLTWAVNATPRMEAGCQVNITPGQGQATRSARSVTLSSPNHE